MTTSSAAIAGPHQHLEAQVRWRTIEIAFWLATLLPFVVTPAALVRRPARTASAPTMSLRYG